MYHIAADIRDESALRMSVFCLVTHRATYTGLSRKSALLINNRSRSATFVTSNARRGSGILLTVAVKRRTSRGTLMMATSNGKGYNNVCMAHSLGDGRVLCHVEAFCEMSNVCVSDV